MKNSHLQILSNTSFINIEHLEKLNEVSDVLSQNLIQYGLIEKGWTYDFHKKKRACGTCYFKKKLISLSIYHIFTPNANWLDTIKHEIAHALSDGIDYGHGKIWKFYCLKVGAIPKSCTNYDAIQVAPCYRAICNKCNRKYKRYRKQRKDKIYYCRHCGIPEGLLFYKKVD